MTTVTAKRWLREVGAACKSRARGLRVRVRQVSHPVARPAFLIIGAQKAGTTSMFRYLMDHSQLVEPITKEIHYFDFNHDRGDAWYQAHFDSKASSGYLTGEATPFYLCHPEVAARVHRYSPDIRLVVLLRDPVSRAVSHYQHERARLREHRSISEAFEHELDELATIDINDPAVFAENGLAHRTGYLLRGYYADYLSRWLEYFDRDQLLVLQSEQFFADTQQALTTVQSFLGVTAESLDTSDIHLQSAESALLDAALQQRCREHLLSANARLASILGPDWQPEAIW